jgi:EPS-associated MarR family transcriptional regulator
MLYVQRLNTPSGHSLSSETDRSHLELMRLLERERKLSQRQVATSLGMSLGKVNYCLKALIQKGFVKAENYRNSENKLAYFYLLTPSGIAAKAELTRRFLSRKMKEYDELKLEIERLQHESERAVNNP